ncbi:MAG: MerR family transcriptional regulator [Acidobacteria bacterium]|nr:MerR family transcriptional regulator [Acidobacteriota bacterium]
MMERTVVTGTLSRVMQVDGVSDDEPCYVISVASRMVGVHAQTLRTYERIGLLTPKRSRGNIRMFSPADVSRARWIKSLMEDLGINLAGVEVMMRMQARLVELERQVRILEERLGSR